jgi:hypothetical protein
MRRYGAQIRRMRAALLPTSLRIVRLFCDLCDAMVVTGMEDRVCGFRRS